jgi:hypothetical protein
VAATDGALRRLEWVPVWGPAVVVAMHMTAAVERTARAAGVAVDTSAIAQAVLAAEGIDLVEPAEIAEEPYKILLDMGESQACQVAEVEVCQQAGRLALVAVLPAERTAAAAALVVLVGSKAGNRREGALSQSC